MLFLLTCMYILVFYGLFIDIHTTSVITHCFIGYVGIYIFTHFHEAIQSRIRPSRDVHMKLKGPGDLTKKLLKQCGLRRYCMQI